MTVEQADFAPGLLEPLPALSALAGAWSQRVDDVDGVRAGSLRGVLVDAITGEPTWGVVKLGRFGRCSAVPVAYLAPGADRVWAAVARDPLRGAAAIDPREGLTVAQERTLLDHYGASSHGRRPELNGREDGERSSIPSPRE